MFDRLIESDTVGADFKSRRRYFLVSTVVVGALFVSAVVFSIYASEIGLGNDTYELTALLTPVQPLADTPEPSRPTERPPKNTNQRSDNMPTRIVSQQRPDETPIDIPPVSVTKNTDLSRPFRDYKISKIESDPVGSSLTPVDASSEKTIGTSVGDKRVDNSDAPSNDNALPPPAIGKPRHLGVINGKATYLPKPPYPASAISLGVQGSVNVQVTIDEEGNVVSAKAASGNPLLRSVSEAAALKARFSPTFLSKVPVKVTGVIVYNFTKN